MEHSLLEKIETSLSKSSSSSAVNIVNDKLTLSVFDLLQKSLSRVSEINLVLRDKHAELPSDALVREFELNPSEALFNAYDITQKNKLQHFEQAKEMAAFIQTHVGIKKTTPKCQIKGNVLLVDDDFMIQGSSSLELAPKSSRSKVSSINFDSVISDTMDKNQIVTAKETFNRIWNNSDFTEDYKDEILKRLEALYKEHSPEFLYYFTLNSLFGHQLDSGVERFEEDNTRFKETKIWDMLYDFQKDCVLSAIQKINKYNGCIIADSVGLGKTFEALAVIKYYELRQDNVLVLTPAKLYDNWNSFKGAYKDSVLDETFYYKIMFHTDLSRYKGESRSGWDLARFDWSKFDLVVIDESHNFRNRIERDEEEGFTRYQRLLYDVIKSNQKTKVLLLSATPVNNSLKDLRNQISIITTDNDAAFAQDGIPSVSSTLNSATRAISQWNDDEDADKSELLDALPSSFYTILEKMTISRSRKHITEFYKNSDVGSFPEKLKPDTHTPHIDTEESLLDFHETNLKLEELLLAVYIPMKYIKAEHRAYYREKYQTKHNDKVIFSHEDREFLTAKMHRFNLFKRLDSSIAAFHQTLTRLLSKIDGFISVLEAGNTDLSYDDDPAEVDGSASLDYKYDLKIAHLKREEYLTDLQTDRFLIQEILKESQQILDEKRDNKLKRLTSIIKEKVSTTPYNDGNKKILIFSAFADTTRYLYAQLDPLCRDSGLNLAMISGSDKPKVNSSAIDHSFNNILSAFSPKSKLRHELPPEKQVDILIGTDCLSEGQNLQDCDCVINYDVQWNPVTLIQRFGRVDRIGSTNTQIKMINFFPDLALNEYLNLENRVKAKMVTANLSSTGGDDILSPEMNDISFRSRQLARLKDEVIDLEDTNENLSLTDLNMNEYLYELAEYLKKTPDLTTTPTGIYSIASAAQATATLLPEDADGVLFCFKHKNIFEKPESDSSLYPYYLVYVARDGSIRLANNQARESLKFLRKACIGQSQPISELVEALLTETDNCKQMSVYSELLNKGIQSIQNKESETSESSVFDFGGFNNPFAEEDADDFELISFLIVRP
jgi:superfamily II DNA or RNA helicase